MRLIDADKLLRDIEEQNLFEGKWFLFRGNFQNWVKVQPTVDAVPVIRCNDCVNRETNGCHMYFDGYEWTEDDGFCYCGCRGETDGQV